MNELNIRFFSFSSEYIQIRRKKSFGFMLLTRTGVIWKSGCCCWFTNRSGWHMKKPTVHVIPQKNEKLINHNVYYSCSFWHRGSHPSLHYRWDKREQVLLLFQGNIIAKICLYFSKVCLLFTSLFFSSSEGQTISLFIKRFALFTV